MWDHLGIVATLLLLGFNVATMAFAVLQRVATQELRIEMGKIERVFTENISSSKREIDGQIFSLTKDLESQLDKLKREFGETISAIRTKVTEVELFSRDTFMRRDSFYEVSRELKNNMTDWGNRIEDRLERMEKKIDGGGKS